ncbi:Exodeoxyribonuclease 7 small subunit (modular protein) [Methylacidimicrobium sp. AP8]|uniref:exodeoxyribonuclease VII small subunit n=1 Tax=Methylacidimicrobium sp. AP8 TaxID=2730359 RepID=UPI0018C0BEDF|nr:exodeoxyribonuclease VII small subunit [Methylacidimicrobium sp. AP8]CAB4243757.1 Exodeoxyribonuclease 7 small subunit (modular protein) [Methylacidimicrobium sp. AP8]
MAKTDAAENAGSFEEAFRRLQEIVTRMESGDLALEDLLDRYEEGMRLVKFCSDKLSLAEQKITVLGQGPGGQEPAVGTPQADPKGSALRGEEEKEG